MTNMHPKRRIPEIFPLHRDQGSFTPTTAREALSQLPQFAELTLPSRKHQVKGKEELKAVKRHTAQTSLADTAA